MAKNEYSERFLNAIEQLGLKNSEIVKNISGVDKTLISHIKNGRQGASMEVISSFCHTYPSVNPDYILTGRGKPLKEEIIQNGAGARENTPDVPLSSGFTVDTEEDYKEAVEHGIRLLPEVDFKFAAGQAELLSGSEDITRYWYLPDCKDCEGVAQVVGNSMIPTLPSGCWVALKRHFFNISRANQIPFGNVFGIVVEDPETGEYHGYIKILRKYKDDKEKARQFWIARSINDEEFDDFDIEITRVRSLWIVKQHVVSDILL